MGDVLYANQFLFLFLLGQLLIKKRMIVCFFLFLVILNWPCGIVLVATVAVLVTTDKIAVRKVHFLQHEFINR